MGKFMVMHEKLYFLKSIKTMSFIYFFPISEQTDWKYVCFCKVTSFSTSGWCWTKFFEEKKTFYVFFLNSSKVLPYHFEFYFLQVKNVQDSVSFKIFRRKWNNYVSAKFSTKSTDFKRFFFFLLKLGNFDQKPILCI